MSELVISIPTDSKEWKYICDNVMHGELLEAVESLKGDKNKFENWYQENVVIPSNEERP